MSEQHPGKEEIVRDVFEKIQDRYDLLDSIISGGMDQRWRRKLISRLDLNESSRVLDCGAGTGKLTRMIIDTCNGCEVISLDITESMFRPSILPDTRFITASAEEIPLEDSSQDAVVSAYLTRNLGSVDRYFSEAYRVLEPGGIFANLDIYNPTMPVFRQLFSIYFYHVVPVIGNTATHSKSYTYLAKSVRNFHSPETITEKIKNAGFSEVSQHRMMLGSIYLHTGKKKIMD